MTIRAHFDGRVLVPHDPLDLPKDQLVEIDVRAVTMDPSPGSPAALLQAIHEPPHLSNDDVAELERAIEAGKLPVRYDGIFDEDQRE